mmetsp:Transcript_12764/g.38001  ORF Transcript_12764/g.38001 Transcript_12764/m.38001 type:complete len:238 (-) Transcript_12764:10-723(-)
MHGGRGSAPFGARGRGRGGLGRRRLPRHHDRRLPLRRRHVLLRRLARVARLLRGPAGREDHSDIQKGAGHHGGLGGGLHGLAPRRVRVLQAAGAGDRRAAHGEGGGADAGARAAARAGRARRGHHGLRRRQSVLRGRRRPTARGRRLRGGLGLALRVPGPGGGPRRRRRAHGPRGRRGRRRARRRDRGRARRVLRRLHELLRRREGHGRLAPRGAAPVAGAAGGPARGRGLIMCCVY